MFTPLLLSPAFVLHRIHSCLFQLNRAMRAELEWPIDPHILMDCCLIFLCGTHFDIMAARWSILLLSVGHERKTEPDPFI